jgi:polyhydroxyalkanoate synthesis regulator phasin
MATATVLGLGRAGESARRLQAEVERLIYRVRAELTDFTRDEARTVGRLVEEARHFRASLGKQAKSAAQRAEKRTESIMNSLEGRVAKAIEPLAKRLDLASYQELAELRDRVDEIEKKLRDLTTAARAA